MSQLATYLFEMLKRDRRYRDELTPEYRALLEEFTVYLKQQQLADLTIERAIYMIGKFLAFLVKLGIMNIGSVSTDVIKTFLTTRWNEGHRLTTNISVSYLTDYFINVKKLFLYLHDNKIILINPASKIQLPEKVAILPRVILTKEEARRILDQPDAKTFYGLRDRALLEILYGCGLRNGEIRRLSIDDVNMRAGTIHIRESKGAKDRVVPLGESPKSWLERYLTFRRAIRPDLKELFLVLEYGHNPMSEGYVASIIKKYTKKAGVDKKVTPHSFRHTFATHLLEEGASTRHIQALLGHSSLESTQIYTKVAIEDIKRVHSTAHPRDGFDADEETRDLSNIKFDRSYEPRKWSKRFWKMPHATPNKRRVNHENRTK